MPEIDIRWEYTEPDPDLVRKAMMEFDAPEIYARVLVRRGVYSREIGRSFFNPSKDHLHDPYLMKDMDVAVNRILEQIALERHIVVFGDYDVDGTTGAAMLSLFLRSIGGRVSTYIPNRESEGYGLSSGGVDYAELVGADLLITCDCGINGFENVNYAREKNIDVIITDHHRPEPELPEAIAVLNPHRADCAYPFKGLCGGGVAFKLALALADKGGHNADLVWVHADLIALGIAADMVPIVDENRVIVHYGLAQMGKRSRPGISALWNASGMSGKDITVGRLVFSLAPKINAAGRLGDANRAVELLTTENYYHAMTMAKELVAENKRRQQIQENTVEEAIYQVNAQHDLTQENALVLHSDNWHQGVIGIVAARIRDLFNRPTAIIATADGIGKGSLRSMAGFDMYQTLTKCKEHLLGYGGHPIAAGLSIAVENLPAFSAAFVKIANEELDEASLQPRQIIDGDCTLDVLDSRFLRFQDSLEPFGPGNMRPVYASRDVEVVGMPRLVGDTSSHLKAKFSQNGVEYDAIGFNMADHFEKLLLKKPLDIAYIVELNEWQGNRTIQLQLKDIKIGG